MTFQEAMRKLKGLCNQGTDYKIRDVIIDEVNRLRKAGYVGNVDREEFIYRLVRRNLDARQESGLVHDAHLHALRLQQDRLNLAIDFALEQLKDEEGYEEGFLGKACDQLKMRRP